MKKIVCLVTLFIGVITSYGQATLRGKVVGSKNDPITSVNVSIYGTSKGSVTDDNGVFVIENISKGKYKLKISMLGYYKKEVSFIIDDNQNKTLPTIKLKTKINQLSEVVVGGKRNKTAIPSKSLRLQTALIKVPQNIQVISDNVLESQMVTSILDKPFRNVSGVTVREHWGNFASVFMRGFRIGAFRNGMNVSENWGPLSEDMAFVDKIEVVKGPSAFMLSAGEPGGLYNVVTKKPTTERIGKISLLAGTQNYYRGALDFGGKIGNDERYLFRVNAMYESKGTHLVHQKPATRLGISPSLLFKITPKTEFLSEFSYQKQKMIPGGAYVFADPANGFASLPRNFSMIDERVPRATMKEVSVLNRLTHRFNENWSVEVKHMLIDYKTKGPAVWGSFEDVDGTVEMDVSYSDVITEGNLAQIYFNGKFDTGSLNHAVLGGFDYSDKDYWLAWGDTYLDFNIYNPIYINGPEINEERSYTNLKKEANYAYGSTTKSVYIQDKISFLEDKVRLTLAGRYTDLTDRNLDEDDVKSTKITPRVGLSVDLLPKLIAYGLFDQSFTPPETDAQYRKPGVEYNPILGTIYEGGLKSRLFSNKLRASVSAFNITKTNYPLESNEEIIDPNTGKGSGEFYEIPDAKVTSKGVELDMQGKITEELSVILNYAFTDVKDSKGTRIAGYAKHTNNAWLTYEFNKKSNLKGFGLSLGYEYQIDRSTWTLDEDGKSQLPNYFRLDGSISWKNDKLRIGLNVNNLLDEYLYSGSNNWGTMNWQTEPGINGRVSLTYNLF